MIQMTREEFYSYSDKNFDELITLMQPILDHRKDLYQRYSRKNDPTEIMGSIDGNKTIVPFEFYITKMVKGYLSGKSPKYDITSDDPDYNDNYYDVVKQIQRYNDDGATFTELTHNYITTAAAYLYTYENEENEIIYTLFDPLQTASVWDYSTPRQLIGILRTWTVITKDDEIHNLEVITEFNRRQYVQGAGLTLDELLSWGDVPCVAMEEPDGIAVYEPAIASINAYEQMINNTLSMTQYNDQAKLLLVGYAMPEQYIPDDKGNMISNPQYEVTKSALLNNPVLSINSQEGDIRWLTKDVNYSGMLEIVTRLHEQITMLTGVPNMTDEAFANADNASALGYKLYSLDQYSAECDRVFKKGYLRLWEIITNRLNLKGGKYDFRDIDIIMQRNIPTDKNLALQRANTMWGSGLFSQVTSINESQVEVDAEEEMARRIAEESSQYESEYEKTLSRNAGHEHDDEVDE